jgi:hypothetical protein
MIGGIAAPGRSASAGTTIWRDRHKESREAHPYLGSYYSSRPSEHIKSPRSTGSPVSASTGFSEIGVPVAGSISLR